MIFSCLLSRFQTLVRTSCSWAIRRLTVASPEPLLSEAQLHLGSDTPPLNADTKHAQDEVIAYEDAVANDYEEPEVSKQPTPPATSGIRGSRAVSSKRSYDEHEFDQHDAQHNASSVYMCSES
jgi:hypothetical protein